MTGTVESTEQFVPEPDEVTATIGDLTARDLNRIVVALEIEVTRLREIVERDEPENAGVRQAYGRAVYLMNRFDRLLAETVSAGRDDQDETEENRA